MNSLIELINILGIISNPIYQLKALISCTEVVIIIFLWRELKEAWQNDAE